MQLQQDDMGQAGAECDHILSLYVETQRALEESAGPLRQLRVHCLKEKTKALLVALEQQRVRLDGA